MTSVETIREIASKHPDPEQAHALMEAADAMEFELARVKADSDVAAAKQQLADTIAQYSHDLTGQDGEDDIKQAATDYVDAQNRRLKSLDPESYNERRQLGLL